jgi:hypothetical protein
MRSTFRRGLLLPRNERTFASAPTAGSTLPACLFNETAMPSSNPFDPGLPTSFPFGIGAVQRPEPVAGFEHRSVPVETDLRSPPGISSLGIRALNQPRPERPILTNSPISLRSPPLFLLDFNDGSSFRVRYRPPDSLSHEPLGTVPSMTPNAAGVNRKETVTMRIPQTKFALISVT